MNYYNRLILAGTFMVGTCQLQAAEFGLEYNTEIQTNFKGNYLWLNFLKTSANVPILPSIAFETSTISTSNTNNGPLIDDRLTYSNIEAGNIPLTFARLGFVITAENAELFVGINNVNEDYFTSDQTSFYINSSCGISPTISCNYDIANYPLASWCIHYRQVFGSFSLQSSLYPGKGYYRLLGHENLFSLKLKQDGIFSITSLDYKRDGIHCILGTALYYGNSIGDEEGEQMASKILEAKKKFTAAPWILTEIALPRNFGIHAHASFSTVKTGCKYYGGVGAMYIGKYVQPGISINYAKFTDIGEWATEVGCKIPIFSGKAQLHPSLHLINTKHTVECIGLLRLKLEI